MKVSIILPVYNVERYLPGCLDSISRQTFRDFEVIAVDDGSTDVSGKLLDDYEASFPMRRIHQPNAGPSAARNAALAAASGDYLLMVDSDDCIHPRLLELAVAAAESERVDFVVFDYFRAPHAERARVMEHWREDAVPAKVVALPIPAFDWFVGHTGHPCVWMFLFRRASLAGRTFAPSILYEDVPFVLGYLAGEVRGVHLEKALYCYSITENSITEQKRQLKRIDGYLAGLRLLRSSVADAQYRGFARRRLSSWIRDLWRKVGKSAEDGERDAEAFVSFLRSAFDEGLLRWGDFSLLWRLRLLLALHRGGGPRP